MYSMVLAYAGLVIVIPIKIPQIVVNANWWMDWSAVPEGSRDEVNRPTMTARPPIPM